MRKILKSFLAAALLTAAAASAQTSPNWTNPYVPSSVEVVPTHDDNRAEKAPMFIVYLNGATYVAPINTDKGKAMLETARQAFLSGRSINVYWDSNARHNTRICDDWDSNGACLRVTTVNFNLIQRISLQ